MNFSAVILAGGKSSRMGRDKAGLEIGGQTMLARQIDLVRAVGAGEVFISGRREQAYAAPGCLRLSDNFANAGPLAGIESALQSCHTPLLLVLAVDMPMMTAELLRQIVASSTGTSGVVPRVAGHLEPLAAVYPQTAGRYAKELLTQATRAHPGAGVFAMRCVHEGLAGCYDFPAAAAKCFISWNEPQEVGRL
jgi:molybdenum cofactor guanylyltransferase